MAETAKEIQSDGLYPKIKRSKYDATRLAIESYLAKRQYSETDIQRKNVPYEQLIVSQLVDKETARPNSILYSTATFRSIFNNDSNLIQVDSNFTKFVIWINSLPETLKSDLSKFVCPLFCHLYLDLLQASYQQSANLLFDSYQEQKVVYANDFCTQVIKEFANPDVKSRAIVKSFRSAKQKIKLSCEALNALRKFLSKYGHIMILQVFQTWFDIEIAFTSSMADADETDAEMLFVCNGEVQDQKVDAELQELQEAISRVNQQVPPPVLLVNVFNSQDNATCGLVSSELNKAIVGFSTSDIHIWGLGNSILTYPKVFGNAARISLGCDSVSKDIWNHDDEEEDSLTSTSAVVLRGHSDSIQDVKIVSEADVLLSVSQDCSMRAWRFCDYSCASIYSGHNYPIWCLDVSIYGVYIATGSYDRTIRLWSLDRLHPTRILAGHTKDVMSVHFHPNACYLASGSADKTIRMWSITDSKAVRLLLGHTGVVYSVAFSPNGQYLATGGDDKCVRIWDLTAAKQLCELNGSANTIVGLSWTKDGKHLASISLDGFIREWNTENVIKKSVNDTTDISSAYNSGLTSLLNIKYDKNWLTCLSASPVCSHS